jgi:hypothetical protein
VQRGILPADADGMLLVMAMLTRIGAASLKRCLTQRVPA